MGVRTRSLSQNLQQIFQPFQRGANSNLRSSTQSVPTTIDKDVVISKTDSIANYKISKSSSERFDSLHQENEDDIVSMTLSSQRNAVQNSKAYKLSRCYRSKSISSPYVMKSFASRNTAELNKQLLSKTVTENRCLLQKVQKVQTRNSNDMTFQPIYQSNELASKLRTKRKKLIKSTNAKPFFSRQNSIEEYHNSSNSQGYSQSFDNLLANELPTTTKGRKKYTKTKSATLIDRPNNLSLPFGGSCGNIILAQQKTQSDQKTYRTIHGTSILPAQQSRPTIFKFVQEAKEVCQPVTNEYSNSDEFDEYDDASMTDSSSSDCDMSFEMNMPAVSLKQSSSLSSVPNIQRRPFHSKHSQPFSRMQSLDFTQSQINVPLIKPNIKNPCRTVPHSRTASPLSSPLQSRAVTPTYFDLESRHHPPQQQQYFKSLNQQPQYNSSMMAGINSMSYAGHQSPKLSMPMINLPKKSSSMSTMVAVTPKNLNSATSLSNIVWQNSPLVRHNCIKYFLLLCSSGLESFFPI